MPGWEQLGAVGLEGLDCDVPLEHRDGRSGLPQLFAQAAVLRGQGLDALLERPDGFGVGAVRGDPVAELGLQVLMPVGENPPFDTGFLGQGLDGQLAVGTDWLTVEQPGHRLPDGATLRFVLGHGCPPSCAYRWAVTMASRRSIWARMR